MQPYPAGSLQGMKSLTARPEVSENEKKILTNFKKSNQHLPVGKRHINGIASSQTKPESERN